jgi:hypothetical protein
VKENQPDLLAAPADAFDDRDVSPRERGLARAERQTVTRCDKGHGRTDRRTPTSTTAPNDYADRPGVSQCFRLTREPTVRGKTTSETAFGMTSVPRECADDPVHDAQGGAQPAQRRRRRQQGRRPPPPLGPSARGVNADQALGMRIERPYGGLPQIEMGGEFNGATVQFRVARRVTPSSCGPRDLGEAVSRAS